MLKTKHLSLFAARSLSLCPWSISLNAQSEWNVTLLEMEAEPGVFFSFYMEYESWTINAERTSLNANVWQSSIGGDAADTYSSTIEFGNGLYRIAESKEFTFPYTFFSQLQYFMTSHRNAFPGFDNDPIDGGISYLGFRMNPESQASLTGHWQSFQYEILFNQGEITDWGFETLAMEITADNTVHYTVTDSTNTAEINETGSFNFSRDGGSILIDDEVEFKLSASGDILLRQVFEGDGTGVVTTFLKLVGPENVDMQDIVGTWALGMTELAKSNGNPPNWLALDSESSIVNFRADGSGTLYNIQSTFLGKGTLDEGEAIVLFDWRIDNSHLVIHAPGNSSNEWVRFAIGASKEIMRNINWEISLWGEFLMFEYVIKIDSPVQAEVKTIPFFAPSVDYFGTWFAQDTAIYTEQWPWIHFHKLGWMRILDGNGMDVWLYDIKLQRWFVTDVLIFPYALGTTEGELYFIDLENSTPENRLIFSYQTGTWLN